MTLLVVGMIAIGGLFYFAKSRFDGPGPLTHSTVVVIQKGEGVNAIASRLEQDGIISDRRIFVASVIYFKAQDKLKAGEYEFRKSASMRNVLDTLVEGKSVLHRLTVAEGMTSDQIVEVLKAEDDLEGEITQIPPEGTLLPDTYKFSRGTTRQDLLERMQADQKSFLAKVWERRVEGLPVTTPEQAIILASIVEKETGRADERPRVASVFINRMKKSMRLQSDPTIIYGIVGGKGMLGRPITRSDIDTPTAYNTYHIKGLPPTAIANPGRAAIEAVLRPAKTADLYFVADGNGGHIFAATLDQHNNNVSKWREIEREMRAKEEAKKLAANKEQAKNGQTEAPGQQPAGEAPKGGPDLTFSGIPGVSVSNTGVIRKTPPAGSDPAANKARQTETAQDAAPVPLPDRNPKVR